MLILDNDEETATLKFQQCSEFRVDDLLVLHFVESKTELVKQNVSYRINRAKELNSLVKERIEEICKIIQSKNPTLMDEIRNGSKFIDEHAALRDEQVRIDTSLWIEK